MGQRAENNARGVSLAEHFLGPLSPGQQFQCQTSYDILERGVHLPASPNPAVKPHQGQEQAG